MSSGLSAIRKLIKNLLKGGEELDEVPEADQATAVGMAQQMIAILEGLEKPELDATGWAIRTLTATKRKSWIIWRKDYVTI
jgi:hypothetical protein